MKQDFFDLLSDQHMEGGQRWSKVKERLETDPRYKAVESSALREELFKQYMEKQAKVGADLCMEDDGFIMYSMFQWYVISVELNIAFVHVWVYIRDSASNRWHVPIQSFFPLFDLFC